MEMIVGCWGAPGGHTSGSFDVRQVMQGRESALIEKAPQSRGCSEGGDLGTWSDHLIALHRR